MIHNLLVKLSCKTWNIFQKPTFLHCKSMIHSELAIHLALITLGSDECLAKQRPTPQVNFPEARAHQKNPLPISVQSCVG